MKAYKQFNPEVKLTKQLSEQMPEFMLMKHQQTGAITGRLFIPAEWVKLESFKKFLCKVTVTWVKQLDNGDLTLWIIAPHSEYDRLLKWYPHHNQFNRGKSWEYLRASIKAES